MSRFEAWADEFKEIVEKYLSSDDEEHGACKTNSIIFDNRGRMWTMPFQYVIMWEFCWMNPVADFLYSHPSVAASKLMLVSIRHNFLILEFENFKI